MAISDFSLDPLEQQEQELDQQQRRALALRLRAPPAMGDTYGQTMRAFNDVGGAVQDRDIATKKKNLSAQYEETLQNALIGAPDEIKAMVLSGATRKEGLELLKKYQHQKLNREDVAAWAKQDVPGPSMGGAAISGTEDSPNLGGISLATAYKMMNSGDKEDRERAKDIIKLYEGHDPKMYAMRMPDGSFKPIKGGRELYAESQGTQFSAKHPQGIPMSDGRGGTYMGDPVTGLPIEPGQPRALPNAVPDGGGGGQPIPAPQGPPSRALPMSAGRPDPQNMEVAPLTPEQIGQINQYRNTGVFPNATAAQQGGGPPPAVMPPGTPGVAPRPDVGVGRTDPPGVKVWEKGREGEIDEYKEWVKSVAAVPRARQAVEELKRINMTPTYSGFKPEIGAFGNALANTLGGESSPEQGNTRQFEAKVKGLAGPLAKELGYNPSNVDLNTALAQLPTTRDDPKTRAKILEMMSRGLDYSEESIPYITQRVQGGMSIQQAQQDFDQMYRAREAQKAQAGPTQPGSASALPGVAAATGGGAPPGPPPDTGGGFSGFMGDVANNARSLPGAIFSSSGLDAMKDQYGNIKEGVKQTFGQGDREAWVKEEERQKARAAADPDYNQASIFHSIANPKALIGGTATAVPKVILASIAQSIINPNATAGGQVTDALVSGAVGGAAALIAKLLPSTKSTVPDMENALEPFKSVKANAAQLDPGSWDSRVADLMGINDYGARLQLKAMTGDIMAAAGMEPKVMKAAGLPEGVISQRAVEEGKKSLAAGFEDVFSNAAKVKLTPELRKNIVASIDRLVETGSTFGPGSTLQKLRMMFDDRNITAINPKGLHEAWKEIGHLAEVNPQAAGAMRQQLETVIASGMNPGKIGQFKALNEKWGNLQDVENVFRMGGEGQGVGAGYLSASGIKAPRPTPNPNSITEQARDAVNKLNLRDARPTELKFDLSKPGTYFGAASPLTGPALHYLDRASNLGMDATHAPKSVKWIIEAMRQGTARGLPTAYTGEQNAP